MASPVFAQSKKSFLDLVKACGSDNPLIESTNSSELIMVFKNGSVIRMVSSESKDNLRGFTVSGILVIDEAAYISQEIWTEILMPTTVIKGQKVLFISTPKGHNWFKEIYELGLDRVTNPQWASYKIRSEENPFMDPMVLEMAKRLLPEKAYLQEYEAEFIQGGGAVFDFGHCARLDRYQTGPEKGKKYYAGLDLAIANDYTVLTILDDEGNVVDWFRENGTSWEQIINKVAMKIRHWNAYTLVEKNSIGSVVYEQLVKLCGANLIEGFNTTQESKRDIIEDLKKAFAESSIAIPNKNLNPQLHVELAGFGYKLSSGGKLTYEGQGGVKDDSVMSLAIAHHCYRSKKAKGTYAVYSGDVTAKYHNFGKYL